MKGFKNTTKTQSGHGEGRATKEHWSIPIARKAMGGIVAPLGGAGPRMGGGSLGAGRPIMPRPRVMPNMKAAPRMGIAKLAKGGRFEGNNLQHTGPYSDNEAAHPTPPARPGYAEGGMHINPKNKGKFTKKMTGSKTGHLTGKDVQRGLHSKSGETRKEANFARMARRGFKPLAEGGPVCDEPAVRKIADQEVGKHVASKPPQGHGVKPRGGLAFNSTPFCGGGRS